MRNLLLYVFVLAFAYAVVGAGLWWQWRAGAYNPKLAGLPDDANTFVFVVTQWPAVAF